ncbi:MAG: YihY/virulence factor BrkB family protein [Gemmatimonadales bacterium]
MATAGIPGADPMAAGGRTVSPLAVAGAYARAMWDKAGQDDLFFLAGGVAFGILAAGVPFVLLLASGLGFALNTSDEASHAAAVEFIQNLFPATLGGTGSLIDPVMHEVVRTRGTVGVFGAVAFIWFSTRLFGSMRSVLLHVFDVPQAHGMVWGKLFDIVLTLATTVLTVLWVAVSTYIALARSSGVEVLSRWGLHAERVMRPLTYVAGRVVAFVLLGALFAVLYKLLPNRPVRWKQAAAGGVACALLFELARSGFSFAMRHYNPASWYTGTLAAVIVVMFWVYYAALIFVLGGEFSQVYEQRHLNLRERAGV